MPSVQAPGVPDANAEWPPAVAISVAGVVAGLAPNDAYADRLSCAEARRCLQAAYEAAGGLPANSTPAFAATSSSSTTAVLAASGLARGQAAALLEGRECQICMEAPRQVRFAPCGGMWERPRLLGATCLARPLSRPPLPQP